MKGINKKLSRMVALAVRKIAVAGSGRASIVGLYQPKVPKKLER